jgi:putative transposase
MKRTRFTDEQIVAMLGENEAGVTAKELCRKYGVSNGTFYKWKEKYGGMQVSDVQRMKALEEENRQLRKLVAQQALDNQALKAVVEKKW